MALAGAWVAFPLLLLAVTTGWGLLVASAAGGDLPAPLLPAVGVCALSVVLTVTSATVPDLALTATVCGALAGLALRVLGSARERRRLVPVGFWPPAAAGLAAFGLLAAPVVLTGAPAVSGYLRLDDTATFLALADWVLAHGRGTGGLAPSTYEATLSSYLAGGYPTGSGLPLVAVGRLSGVELAWLWMPYLAVLGGLLASAVALLVRPLARAGWMQTVIGAAAACSALLLGYLLWGGAKEIWAASAAATVAALVPWTVERIGGRRGGAALRALVPIATGVAGLVCALSVAGAVWAVPAVAVAAVAVAVVRGHGRRVPVALGGMVLLALAMIPLVRLVPFVDAIAQAPSSGPEWLGNLLRPLRLAQVGGVWPARDFRVDPVHGTATTLLLLAVAAGAAYGLWRGAAARAWGLLAYAGVLISAGAVLVTSDWAWAEGKALAIASPVPLALAGAGAGALLDRDRSRLRRAAGALLGGALVIGVCWSYALAFQGTTLSPYDRHRELALIGERFAGGGPALGTEFEPYAGRWFLRRMTPEIASELRRRTIPLRDGTVLRKGESADIDRFALDTLADYRLLVLRRSPAASRPPSLFRRVWRGRWYEVWERSGGRPVLDHLGLGSTIDPAAVPACADVRRLAGTAGPRGVVRAALAPAPAVAGLAGDSAPPGWRATGGGALFPDARGTGTARATVSVPAQGRYDVWLGGSFRGAAVTAIDGVPVGRDRHQLSFAGNWVPFGAAGLSAGPHAVTVRLDGGGVHPGVRGINRFGIGPVALVPAGAGARVIEVPSRDAGALCGRRLDWVEAVG